MQQSWPQIYPDMILGLSDHTPGHATVLGAVVLGARIIEKHFTLNKLYEGTDHILSATQKELKELRTIGDNIFLLRGNRQKTVTKEEKKITQEFSDMVLQAVVDEDYKMGLQIQTNISKLESHDFVYGKNEPAVQNYHNWIEQFMDKKGSER